MATLTAARAASDQPVFKAGGAGILCQAYGVYTIAANPTAADILQGCRIPAGAVVTGGRIYAPDLDTNATETLDFDVGWNDNGTDTADPDGFGNFGVVTGDVVAGYKPVAGIMIQFQGVLLTAGPVTFSAETIIQVVFNVAAATGGTGVMTIVADYLNP
ncbi:hypothetical protein KAR91_12850 [Candidatus Pacearchaeota archaeon]|nr:hypothetical protein [Candidatus Pacearchaeota archaeon]